LPIRPEYRQFYGREWRAYRLVLLSLRGSRCTACKRDVPKYLNLAHITNDPLTSSVAFLCPACHTRHDARHSMAVRRRNEATQFGQLWILPEIEFAVTPLRRIPDAAFRAIEAARQGALFG
jgi:hypothetical protein